MKLKNIKTRLLVLVIITVLASIAALSILTLSQIKSIGNYAASNSSVALEDAGTDQLLQYAVAYADMSTEKLNQIQTDATMLQNVVTSIYQNPEEYTARPAKLPLEENGGTVVVHQFFDSTYVESPETLAEIELLANIQDFLEQFARNNPAISAGSIYVATESGIIFMADTESDKHDEGFLYDNIHGRPWYQRAESTGELGWTDVVTDESGRGTGIICSAPVYDQAGTLQAVVGVGALLIDLEEIIDTNVGETGHTFILNEKGNIILSPIDGELSVSPLVTGDNGATTQDSLLNSDNQDLVALSQSMIAGGSGYGTITVNDETVYAAYAPIETLGWSLGAVITTEEILAPSVAIEAQIADSITQSVILVAILALVIVVVVIAVGNLLANRISKPIVSLTQEVSKVGDGNFEYVSNIHTGDEIQLLSTSFEDMAKELKHYIADLTAATAERERLGAELDVAKNIQASMLPSIFPAFPGRKEFDIHATMTPAKEVGGDFYDFFMVDDNHLALVMADVSGKGVPAALFMVIAKTLLKNAAQLGLSPKEILEKVNNQLCENNEADMFVTVWIGIMEVDSGKLVCSNAGHEFPAICRAGGQFELIHDPHGFVLAGMEDMPYTEYDIQLHPGDVLYVYTDGVPEATNGENVLFDNERMLMALNDLEHLAPEMLLHKVQEHIDRFVGEAPQFDDITMLGLKYKGKDGASI